MSEGPGAKDAPPTFTDEDLDSLYAWLIAADK